MPAVIDLVAARRAVQASVRDSLLKTQALMARHANAARRPLTFQPGDRAWLSTRHLPVRLGARKLLAKWAGPYEIVESVGAAAYRLSLPPAWRVHPVFHVSQLKEATAVPQDVAPVVLDD
jgi:hypothetical protein